MPEQILAEQNPPHAVPNDLHHENKGHYDGQAIPRPRQNAINHTFKKKANINLATLNMNGATAPTHNMNLTEKWSTINYQIRAKKIAILALQETHLDELHASDVHTCFQKNFELLYSCDPENPRTHARVAFVLNKALVAPKFTKVVALIPGRAAILTITWSDIESTSILNIYAPANKQSQPEFWDKLERRRRRAHIPRPDFVLGDFNVMEDLLD